jgi:Zn-dependent peptidase ImmA (M78 family)/DNA-binding XRE family transcriptional regulator
MFNPNRLELARKRRKLTSKALADSAKISAVTLSRAVNGIQLPDDETIKSLAEVLNFPVAFFFKDDVDKINPESASFRSYTSMTAKERDAALSAGSLAFELADLIRRDFNLPVSDILDLSHERNPAQAARLLREYWGIGEKPIANMIRLLETKGVRVFSLSESTRTVDAFSCWRNNEPFVFLNTFKSAERSRFDAAHELAHLVLHKHGGTQQGRMIEVEANTFASAFLMPEADVVATVPFVTSISQIISAKKRWGVAAVALAYRLHKLGRITEWQYIQVNRSYRTSEPQGLPAERSSVWEMVLRDLWKRGISRNQLARELLIPTEELENLLFGLAGDTNPPNLVIGKTVLRSV